MTNTCAHCTADLWMISDSRLYFRCGAVTDQKSGDTLTLCKTPKQVVNGKTLGAAK